MTTRRRWWIVGALIAAGVVLAGVAWMVLHGYTTRERVEVVSASYWVDRSQLMLTVGTCGGDPELSKLEETATQVDVEVVSTVPRFRGSNDCLDVVEVTLPQPLGQRQVVDLATGQVVDVELVQG